MKQKTPARDVNVYLATVSKEWRATYDIAKTTIRFPAGQPLPAARIKKLVKARIAENEARRKKEQNKKE